MNTSAIAASALLLAACSALAGPVTFEYEGTAQGRNLNVNIAGFYEGEVFAGNVRHNIDGLRTLGFCIDPDQFVQRGTETFEMTDLTAALDHRAHGDMKAAAIAELAANAGDTIWTEQADRDTAAAFQIAVWEIVTDLNIPQRSSTLNLASGDFSASGNSAVLTLAGDMLAALTFTNHSTLGIAAYIHPEHQDYMTRVIPAPAPTALAAVALPVLVRRRRR